MKETAFVVLGSLLVFLGTAGIFLPLLPTTPFLLLAAYLFSRSNPRLHGWLLGHRHLGPYIHAFRNKTGLTVTQKFRVGTTFTIMLGISIFFAPILTVRIMLAGMWMFWITMLLRMKTAEEPG